MSEIYEYAVIYQEKPADKNAIKPKGKLIVEITQVLVDSEAEAQMIAARAIPDDYVDKLEDITVVVRPF